MCKDVLKTYASIAAELSPLLSEESWEVLLKVNIGVTNKFLTEMKSPCDPAEQIAQPLIDNLFDVWLRSGVQSPLLFDKLSTYSSEWIHRENVIDAWARVCRGLTRRMLTVIYGAKCCHYAPRLYKYSPGQNEFVDSFLRDQDRFVIVQPSESLKEQGTAKVYQIADEQVVYFWYRFLLLFERRLVDSREKKQEISRGSVAFSEPENYQLYVRQLASLLKEFYTAGGSLKGRTKDIHYEAAEIDRASRFQVPARFPQSADFVRDTEQLYCADAKKRI